MYQKVVIVGNLGTDPEMRYTQSGQAVTNFSIATNRKWTDGQGNQQEEVTWFRVSTWGKLAEICNQYLSKGRQVMVEGRLRGDPETGGPRIWTAQDGSARANYELNALEVKFLGTRGEYNDPPGGGGASGSAPAAPGPGMTEDEIPF